MTARGKQGDEIKKSLRTSAVGSFSIDAFELGISLDTDYRTGDRKRFAGNNTTAGHRTVSPNPRGLAKLAIVSENAGPFSLTKSTGIG